LSKKSEIVDAAMQLFAAKGYEKSSIAEVAAMIGTASSNILYHFSTKEDLLLAILCKVKDELIEAFQLEVRTRSFETGMDMIEGLAAAYLTLSTNHPSWFMLLHHRFPYEMAAVNPIFREHLEAIYASIIGLFEKAIRTGQSDGSVLTTPPHRAAMIVFAMIDGVVRYNTYNLYQAGTLFSELMDSCRRMFQANHRT
jgi:AcrR family transcriptional regulator